MNQIYLFLTFFITCLTTISLSFIIFFTASSSFSCSTKKKIIYFQDYDTVSSLDINYEDYKVQIDDVLKIDVKTEEPATALIFNPSGVNNSFSGNLEGLLYNGYQVNTSGYINFPRLGKIKVAGMTISEVRDFIFNSLIEAKILTNPSIDVKVLNNHFTILGEVNSPGKYDFLKNNMNILEAIGIAGDLTINGVRSNIKILRNGKINSLDLTKSNFLESDFFQIVSGDVIIVNPNINRVKNAGIIGNSGTLLSLLSFLLSSIIIITR